MSEVVKSPNRNRPKPVEIRQSEYERLGVNPTAFSLNNYARPEASLPVRKQPFSQTVSEVDGSSFDDNGKHVPPVVKKDSHIIDNNEFLSFGFGPERKMSDAIDNGELIDLDLDFEIEAESKSSIPAVGDYILMISGDVIMSGSLDIIESKVKDILYGEDEEFELSVVPQEDIVVLKRVDIQIGVFIKD